MLKRIEEIVREAGQQILLADQLKIEQKEGHGNFVTDADARVQDYLMGELAALCPQAHFFCEERENERLTDALTWVIDPIDGTTNFIHRFQMSTVSVALLENRKPILACIGQPYAREIYSAEQGKGALLNGSAIHVSEFELSRSLIGFGTSPYQEELAEASFAAVRAFLKRCVDVRRTGSAALDLAYVSSGRLDVFFELNLKPWDVAAGSLMVEEAGGVWSLPLLKEKAFSNPTAILAANAVCAENAQSILCSAVELYGISQELLDRLNGVR